MGMDLSRLEDGEKWTCSNTLWGYILESAEKGGWKPEGTSKYDEESDSEDPNWDEFWTYDHETQPASWRVSHFRARPAGQYSLAFSHYFSLAFSHYFSFSRIANG